MIITYSQSFNIPSGGWTGQCNGIMYAGSTSSAAGLTAFAVLWRDATYVGNTLTNNTPTTISLTPGIILPVKARWISHAGVAGTVTGFN